MVQPLVSKNFFAGSCIVSSCFSVTSRVKPVITRIISFHPLTLFISAQVVPLVVVASVIELNC